MLPCAAGGPDGVCTAISQLSRELLEGHVFPGERRGLEASTSGCDSSDCLFCQYRSNSPFHLHAYAGKLTTLLRKRQNSLSAAALSAIPTPVDAAAALLATSGTIGGHGRTAKRQRGSIAPPCVLQSCSPCGLQPTAGNVTVPERPSCGHASDRPLARDEAHGRNASQEAAEHSNSILYPIELPPARPSGEPQHALQPQHQQPGHDDVKGNGATPQPITVSAFAGYSHAPQPTEPGAWQQPPIPVELPLHAPGRHADSAGTGGLLRPSSGGLQLPPGWSFRQEWVGRTTPAPALLSEVVRLPGPGPGGGSSRPGRVVGHQSEIVCALEFSPCGMLLAAGGVDKQIRLYNLSGLMGVEEWSLASGEAEDDDPGDEVAQPDDDEDDDDDDDDDDEEDGARGRGSGRGSRRRLLAPLHPGRCLPGGSPPRSPSTSGLLACVHRMPSKVSSIAWSPYQDGVVTVGDYDGVLLQLHLASGHQLADVDAHSGRKIWSVTHSPHTPHLAASAADDRAARLWAGPGLSSCVGVVRPNPAASVTCVDFSPDASCPHLLAMACSDRAAYLYDVRQLAGGPLAVLRGHSRPASYCRFLGGRRLVTAATDASIALWDLDAALGAGTGGAEGAAVPSSSPSSWAVPQHQPCRVFRGHRNDKNFVGLSVRPSDGLIACGSECSRTFAYHTSWSSPLATLDLLGLGAGVGGGLGVSLGLRTASGSDAGAGVLGVPQPPVAVWGGPDGALGRVSSGSGSSCMRRRSSTGGGGGGSFVSAVCWQPAAAGQALGLPPLLASATSFGGVSLGVLAAAGCKGGAG